jgi:hypothetical protein
MQETPADAAVTSEHTLQVRKAEYCGAGKVLPEKNCWMGNQVSKDEYNKRGVLGIYNQAHDK